MKTVFAFTLALAAHSPTAPELCSGFESRIANDMRILEADLSKPAAIEATEKLRRMIELGEVSGMFAHGALNQTKVINGHILLQHANAVNEEFGAETIEFREAKTGLCSWLVAEGFWYD